MNEFLLRKLDITQQPAKDNLYLYDKYNDRAPPIEKPPTAILSEEIPSEISLSINSVIVVQIEFIDSLSSNALIDMPLRSNHTWLG